MTIFGGITPSNQAVQNKAEIANLVSYQEGETLGSMLISTLFSLTIVQDKIMVGLFLR